MQTSHFDDPLRMAREEGGRAEQAADPGSPQRQIAVNPWVIICVLAIAGWSADSLLVSIELQRLDGGDIRAHLTHF